jgi:hypothetical protein
VNKRWIAIGSVLAVCWFVSVEAGNAQSAVSPSQPANTAAATTLSDWSEPAVIQPSVGQNYLQPSASNCNGCSSGCNGEQVWATITPYLWLPAMKGQVGVGPTLVDVNLSLSDMWDLLGDLKGAAMVHLEVGRGNRGIIVDTLLTDIASTETLPSGAVGTAETTLTILEGLGVRRVYSQNRCGNFVRGINWDVLYGVRYYQIGMELNVVPPVGAATIAERTENWVDLVMGTRTSMKLANGGSAFARADFGGFGLGSSSDFVWNLQFGLENRLRRHPNTSSVLGYKVLDIKQSKGSGADAFLFDMNLHGPFAALMFRF